MSDLDQPLQVGAIVWGKISGYPWWPAKVHSIISNKQTKKPDDDIYVLEFFYDNTTARLPNSKLLTFQEGLSKMPQKPPIQLKKALALAKNEIKPNSEDAKAIVNSEKMNEIGVDKRDLKLSDQGTPKKKPGRKPNVNKLNISPIAQEKDYEKQKKNPVLKATGAKKKLEEKKQEARPTRDERASLRNNQTDLSTNQEEAENTSLQSKLARGRKKAQDSENENNAEINHKEKESDLLETEKSSKKLKKGLESEEKVKEVLNLNQIVQKIKQTLHTLNQELKNRDSSELNNELLESLDEILENIDGISFKMQEFMDSSFGKYVSALHTVLVSCKRMLPSRGLRILNTLGALGISIKNQIIQQCFGVNDIYTPLFEMKKSESKGDDKENNVFRLFTRSHTPNIEEEILAVKIEPQEESTQTSAISLSQRNEIICKFEKFLVAKYKIPKANALNVAEKIETIVRKNNGFSLSSYLSTFKIIIAGLKDGSITEDLFKDQPDIDAIENSVRSVLLKSNSVKILRTEEIN